MNFEKMVDNNKILEIKTGSHLYGLATENSDIDYGGIFIPSKEIIFGFEKCDEVDLSFISKLDNNKNSPDAIDRKFYNIKKFVKLAEQNNPNILEYLFVNKENIIFINDYGEELLSKSDIFPHQGLKDRFVKYAISQKNKMIIKRENYNELENGAKILLGYIDNDEGRLLLPQCEKYKEFTQVFKMRRQTDNHYKIGDINIVKNQTVKRAFQEINKRIGEKTNRKELIKAKGYDYKFGSHLIRLLIEGKDLLENGKLEFPIRNRDKIMEIKSGKWELKDVLNYADYLESEIEKIAVKSDLPKEPRSKEIQDFVIDVFERWFRI